jgi:hypothetical protein
MSLPFVKVRCDEWLQRAALVQWGDQRAPVLWVEMDLAILTATGRLDDLSVRDLAKRWGWPRSTTARKVKEGVGRIWDSSGTLVGQERDTPAEVEPAQSTDAGTAVGQQWDSSGTRAQSSIESKKRLESQREQQASKENDKPSPKQLETAQGIACLRTLRDEHLRGQGKKASSWGKAKGTEKRVGRFLSECRARQEELDAEPLACLEALGRWVFDAPAAEFWRRLPSPLEKVLGGKANDDCDRMARAKEALAWVAGGQSTTPEPKPRRGKPEHWSVQLAREQAEAAERERTVITPDPRLFGGTQ